SMKRVPRQGCTYYAPRSHGVRLGVQTSTSQSYLVLQWLPATHARCYLEREYCLSGQLVGCRQIASPPARPDGASLREVRPSAQRYTPTSDRLTPPRAENFASGRGRLARQLPLPWAIPLYRCQHTNTLAQFRMSSAGC